MYEMFGNFNKNGYICTEETKVIANETAKNHQIYN